MPYPYGDNYWPRALDPGIRIATTNSAQMWNRCYPGLVLCVEITVNAGGLATITPGIDILYPWTPTWFRIFTAAAGISALGLYCYSLYPTVAAVPATTYTQEVRLLLPRDFRVSVAHTTADPVTYSAGVSYVKG